MEGGIYHDGGALVGGTNCANPIFENFLGTSIKTILTSIISISMDSTLEISRVLSHGRFLNYAKYSTRLIDVRDLENTFM